MDAERIAIVEGVRTPFTRDSGLLGSVPSYELARFVIRSLMDRLELDEARVDAVIFGSSLQDHSTIRKAVLLAGLPPAAASSCVSRGEGSGLEAIRSAYERLTSGSSECVLAVAVPSDRNDPEERGDSLFGLKPERMVQEYSILREEQDAFALRSHRAAVESRPKLLEEVAPYPVPPEYEVFLRHDRGPREGISPESFLEHEPLFGPRGTMTAGNTCFAAKGAVALLLMKEATAKRLGHAPLGYIRAFASSGLPSELCGLGPAMTIPPLLRKLECPLSAIDLFELEESSAALLLASRKALADRPFCRKHLGWVEAVGEIPQDRLNVCGGAIAVGQLAGASGARSVLSLLRELKRRGAKLGIVALESNDGQALAVALERDA